MKDMNTTAIGKDTLSEILGVTDELARAACERFKPFEEIYRLGDGGCYVSADVFDKVWERHPEWWLEAWMLADNGQFSFEDVAEMSIAEIREAYGDPDFEPEHAFMTEADELGFVAGPDDGWVKPEIPSHGSADKRISSILESADRQAMADPHGTRHLYSSEEGPFKGVHSIEAYQAYFDADPTGDLAEQKEAGTTFESWMDELRRFDLVCDAGDEATVSPAGDLDSLEFDARACVEEQASEMRADMKWPTR